MSGLGKRIFVSVFATLFFEGGRVADVVTVKTAVAKIIVVAPVMIAKASCSTYCIAISDWNHIPFVNDNICAKTKEYFVGC